jgi:hypothetical protein
MVRTTNVYQEVIHVSFLQDWGFPMVDTVKIEFNGVAKIDIPPRKRLTLTNGARLWYDGIATFRAEAELPKLLWGHNGRLITNQEDLDASLELLRSSLQKYVEFSSWQFVRIDLCWQFNTDAKAVILAHQWTCLPGIRKRPTVFDGGKQISWRGGRSRVVLKMYQKSSSPIGESKTVLRVELTLAGAGLRCRINPSVPLRFDTLWKAFRGELIKLPAPRVPERRKHSFAEIIAALAPECQKMGLLIYQAGRTAQSVSNFEKQVGTACLQRIVWDWGTKLPSDHPPIAVHVDSKRSLPRRHPCAPKPACERPSEIKPDVTAIPSPTPTPAAAPVSSALQGSS